MELWKNFWTGNVLERIRLSQGNPLPDPEIPRLKDIPDSRTMRLVPAKGIPDWRLRDILDGNMNQLMAMNRIAEQAEREAIRGARILRGGVQIPELGDVLETLTFIGKRRS